MRRKRSRTHTGTCLPSIGSVRSSLLGKTVYLLSFSFYVFLLASLVLIGGAPFARAGRCAKDGALDRAADAVALVSPARRI